MANGCNVRAQPRPGEGLSSGRGEAEMAANSAGSSNELLLFLTKIHFFPTIDFLPIFSQ